MAKEVIVISLGGSRIIPHKIDVNFLKRFKKAILKISRKSKVVICTGGGKLARDYIQALERFNVSEKRQNLSGIAATRLNASLLANVLGMNEKIPESLKQVKGLLRKHNIVVCGGMKPGRTSDGTTAEIARFLKAGALVNITNVKGLYDKDPKKFKNAEFIAEISHRDFARMAAKVRKEPGQHFVLDSVAAKIAMEEGIKVIIIKDIAELLKYLSGKKFKGTIIKK